MTYLRQLCILLLLVLEQQQGGALEGDVLQLVGRGQQLDGGGQQDELALREQVSMRGLNLKSESKG